MISAPPCHLPCSPYCGSINTYLESICCQKLLAETGVQGSSTFHSPQHSAKPTRGDAEISADRLTCCQTEAASKTEGFILHIYMYCSQYLNFHDRAPKMSQMIHYILSVFIFQLLFLYVFGCITQHVGSQFLDQGSNLHLLHWKHSLNHWTTREIPSFSFFKAPIIWHHLIIQSSSFLVF